MIHPILITGLSPAMQSPIDVRTADVKEDPCLVIQELRWNYKPSDCRILYNTGKGWKVKVEGKDSYVSGGPLANTYQFLEFHGHWGKCPASGSEHTVNGKAYAGELHFVHWNVDVYPNPETATKSPTGLAVIGVFLKEGEQNVELVKVTDMLTRVGRQNEEHTLPEGVDPVSLFPDNRDYWTYEGSLTTPNFYESVTWILFKNPIEVSHQQLEMFRSMTVEFDDLHGNPVIKKVEENCRETQDMNGRIVREPPPHSRENSQ